MVYDYSFSVWPDEESPRMTAAPAVFTLFRVIQPRALMEFTERGFGDFREELARVGLTLREVERVPHHEPEHVG